MTKVKMVVLIGLVALGAVYAGTRPEDMTREAKNKKIVLNAIRASDKGDWEEWEEQVAARFVLYGPRNRKPVDRKICRANLVKQHKAVKDGERKIHDIIAKDDKVIVRMELKIMVKPRAYKVGEADKLTALEFPEISIFRIEGGQIVEQWVECDAWGFRGNYRGYHFGGWTK